MKTSKLFGLVLTLLSVILLSGCNGGGGGGGTVKPSVQAQIQTQMKDFTNLFTSGTPATAAIITAKLSPDFLMDGMNAATYAKQLTSAAVPAVASGDTFVVTLATVFDSASQSNAVATAQWVDATQLNAAGAIVGKSRIKFENVSGIWLMAGNQRAVQLSLRAESGMTASTSPQTFSSDVNLSIDPTTASLAGSGVATALVTGPSVVPASGVTVYSNAAPATTASAKLSGVIQLCDATIVTNCTNAVDGSVYTITLSDTAGAVIATYTEVLDKAPLAASALTAAMFPSNVTTTIAGVTPATITQVTPGASMSVSWTNPAGLVSDLINFTVWDLNGVLAFQQTGLPSGNSFSGNLPTFTPLVAGSGSAVPRFEVTVQAADAHGRQYVVFN